MTASSCDNKPLKTLCPLFKNMQQLDYKHSLVTFNTRKIYIWYFLTRRKFLFWLQFYKVFFPHVPAEVIMFRQVQHRSLSSVAFISQHPHIPLSLLAPFQSCLSHLNRPVHSQSDCLASHDTDPVQSPLKWCLVCACALCVFKKESSTFQWG